VSRQPDADLAVLNNELLEALLVEVRALRAGLSAPKPASALMDAAELAEVLKVDARTVRRWEVDGTIPKAIQIGGAKRWKRAVIDRFLAEERP
jgi:hypothetical protein